MEYLRNSLYAAGFCIMFTTQAVAQDAATQVQRTAANLFDEMPAVQFVAQIDGLCGAGAGVNDIAVYCTSQNTILVAADQRSRDVAGYYVAHLLGHAVQVRHGVADVALRTINQNRNDEVKLRAMVARQVDCVAGFIYAASGLPAADLNTWLAQDPFADIHWGRDPLRVGSVMGIGLAERNAWFARGQAGDISACASGIFGSELLVKALNR